MVSMRNKKNHPSVEIKYPLLSRALVRMIMKALCNEGPFKLYRALPSVDLNQQSGPSCLKHP